MTFVDDVLIGRAVVDDVERYVDQWHEGGTGLGLHEYLGFLWPEYVVYMELEEAADYIIRARRLGQDLRTYLSSRKENGPEEVELWADMENYDEEWAAVYRGESGEPWRDAPVPVHPDTAKLITTIPSTRRLEE